MELRDPLAPAKHLLTGECLPLQKSFWTAFSQKTVLHFRVVCKGENYHYFHLAGGKLKHKNNAVHSRPPNQGPLSRFLCPVHCPVGGNHEGSLRRGILCSHNSVGFTNIQTLNNDYSIGIKELLTF